MAFLRLTLLVIVISSCAESSPRPSSRADLFSGEDTFGKTWQVQEIELEIGILQPSSCVTDNFITYYPNGTYEINEGASKCDPNDPPGTVGTWYLDKREETLFIEIDGNIQRWEIDLTKKDLHRLTSSFEEGNRTYTFISSN